MIAVYLHHTEAVTLSVTVAEEHMMILSTASAAAPMYNLPKPDPIEATDDFMLADWQYMLIGVVMGVIGTLLYWRYATQN